MVVPAVAAGTLVVAAAVAASFSQFPLGTGEPWSFGRRGDRQSSEPGPTPEVAEPPPRELPNLFTWTLVLAAVVFVLLLVLLVLVAIAVWNHRRPAAVRVRRRRVAATRQVATSDPAPPVEPPLMAAVDASLAALADGDDPRAAVIACWLRLQTLAASTGVAAHAADTADDLVLRLLRSRRVREQVLVDLAEVYRRARYSPHPVDERMSQAADAALRQLRQELVDSPVGAGSGQPG
jgi:hypothetical protein